MAAKMKFAPVVLVIFDGFGLNPLPEGNAIVQANTPNLDLIRRNYPGTALAAAGINVGLVWGEFGNSQVGHRTLGSGVVLYQNLPRISLAIEDGSFYTRPALLKAAEHVKKNNSAFHIMGLLGNGGIHSHTDHMIACINFAAKQKFKKVYLHLFTDGIDTPIRSAPQFLKEIEQAIKEAGVGEIATIVGRDLAMDREEHWDKTGATYNLLVKGQGEQTKSADDAIKATYKNDLNDEKVPPTVIIKHGKPVGLIGPGDAAIYTNYRNDRERQLTEIFSLPSFDKFDRGPLPQDFLYLTMVQYEEALPVEIVFPPQNVKNPLANIISDAGLKQFHVAETDKYAHVTFFFNGGNEKPYPGEDRELVPSKTNIASYADAPQMSAAGITKQILAAITSQKYAFIVANYANSDMVGHTGNLKAAIKAIEVLDHEIGSVMKAVLDVNGALLITADHGNSEEMIDAATGDIKKQHSTNAVPFHLIAKPFALSRPKTDDDLMTYYNPPAGVLADVAPTVLELMGLKKNPDMTGVSLLQVIN